MTPDEDYLKKLSIFHYVVAGLAGLFALFPVIHLVVGLSLVFAPQRLADNDAAMATLLGWFFVIIAIFCITFGLTFAVCVFIAGRSLARHRRYPFCLVMAGTECIFVPFGTVLGVLTLVVLTRDSVKQLFAANAAE